MITQLGKELKKLRIDLGVTLMGLSELVDLSPAFLSAIETGRKRVPDNFLDTLAAKIPVVAKEREKYEVLINQARKEVRMPLDTANYQDAMLATEFARRFGSLSESEKSRLNSILKGE
ncbi:MAG: helix-turn-helix domain-containing protein [Deltaproteobacteria bacterium]|nr:helix-turn-helix domain-containing protein [Deltaproteobacteria bacterium]